MKKKAKGHAMLHHSCFQDYYPQILEKYSWTYGHKSKSKVNYYFTNYLDYIIRAQELQGGHFLFFNLQILSATLLSNLGSLITDPPEYFDISTSTDPSS